MKENENDWKKCMDEEEMESIPDAGGNTLFLIGGVILALIALAGDISKQVPSNPLNETKQVIDIISDQITKEDISDDSDIKRIITEIGDYQIYPGTDK